MSVDRSATGSRPAGSPAGSSRRARPTSRSWPPPTTRPVAAAGRVHLEPRRRRAGADQPHHLHDGRAAAVVLNSGNANAATGEAGRTRRAAHGASSPPTALGCAPPRRARLLHRADRHPDADGPGRGRDPEAGRRRSRADVDGGAAAADAILTTDTVRKETVQHVRARRTASSATIGGHGQGRGDAVAGDGHDARGAHHRRRRRSEHAARDADARRSPTRSTASSSTTARAPTTPCSCSPTARSATRRSPARAAPTRPSATRLAAACADLARQMAADAEGATKLATVVVRGARSAAEARTRGARRRRAASSCSARCTASDPYWGRVLSELGASGARFDPERVDVVLPGRASCAATASPRRTTRPRSAALMRAARHRDRLRPRTPAPGTRTVTFTDLTHAYVDENMGTS